MTLSKNNPKSADEHEVNYQFGPMLTLGLPILSLAVAFMALFHSMSDSRSAQAGRLASARVVAMKLSTDFHNWPVSISTARVALASGLVGTEFDEILSSSSLKASLDRQWRPILNVTPDDMGYLASGAPLVAERVGKCIAEVINLDRVADLTIESINKYLNGRKKQQPELELLSTRVLAQESIDLFRILAGDTQSSCVAASDALQSLAYPERPLDNWGRLVPQELLISGLEEQQVPLHWSVPLGVDTSVLERRWRLNMKANIPRCATKNPALCDRRAPHEPKPSNDAGIRSSNLRTLEVPAWIHTSRAE